MTASPPSIPPEPFDRPSPDPDGFDYRVWVISALMFGFVGGAVLLLVATHVSTTACVLTLLLTGFATGFSAAQWWGPSASQAAALRQALVGLRDTQAQLLKTQPHLKPRLAYEPEDPT